MIVAEAAGELLMALGEVRESILRNEAEYDVYFMGEDVQKGESVGPRKRWERGQGRVGAEGGMGVEIWQSQGYGSCTKTLISSEKSDFRPRLLTSRPILVYALQILLNGAKSEHEGLRVGWGRRRATRSFTSTRRMHLWMSVRSRLRTVRAAQTIDGLRSDTISAILQVPLELYLHILCRESRRSSAFCGLCTTRRPLKLVCAWA